MTTPDIHWPARYHPEASPIHAVNAIDVDAPSARVWELLVNPYRWPEYYPHAVAREVSSGQTLTAGATFVMHTADVDLYNTVREFDPQHRISWEDLYADGSAAYHAWVITPSDYGCHVHTEETQQGPFWEELARKMPGALHQYHQTWVENLAAAARSAGSAAHAGQSG